MIQRERWEELQRLRAAGVGIAEIARRFVHWFVEEEERYLTRAHGEPYRAYGRRVGRFLPGLGRFR